MCNFHDWKFSFQDNDIFKIRFFEANNDLHKIFDRCLGRLNDTPHANLCFADGISRCFSRETQPVEGTMLSTHAASDTRPLNTSSLS